MKNEMLYVQMIIPNSVQRPTCYRQKKVLLILPWGTLTYLEDGAGTMFFHVLSRFEGLVDA